MKSIRNTACLALLAACSHEATRENLFDPGLTALVRLHEAVDK